MTNTRNNANPIAVFAIRAALVLTVVGIIFHFTCGLSMLVAWSPMLLIVAAWFVGLVVFGIRARRNNK
jgi:hypothetical protein